MRNNLLSYEEMINYFGEDKVTDRYRFLYDKMQEYIRIRQLEDKLYVHVGTLQQAVMDYFVDMHRMKEFHRIEKADMMDILAYEIYWIVRRKPIQPAPNAEDSRLVFANEGFATTLVAHELMIPSDGYEMNEDEEEAALSFLRDLNYHLKYRNLDKQALELMLHSIQTGKKVSGGIRT